MPAPSEYSAVRDVLERYISGSYTADVGRLKTCFHPDARMSGYLGDTLDIGTPQPFYDELEAATSSKESGENYQAEIGFIHIAGRMASASIIEDNLLQTNYVNHFQLLKIEGQWRIVGKIYTDV